MSAPKMSAAKSSSPVLGDDPFPPPVFHLFIGEREVLLRKFESGVGQELGEAHDHCFLGEPSSERDAKPVPLR